MIHLNCTLLSYNSSTVFYNKLTKSIYPSVRCFNIQYILLWSSFCQSFPKDHHLLLVGICVSVHVCARSCLKIIKGQHGCVLHLLCQTITQLRLVTLGHLWRLWCPGTPPVSGYFSPPKGSWCPLVEHAEGVP